MLELQAMNSNARVNTNVNARLNADGQTKLDT